MLELNKKRAGITATSAPPAQRRRVDDPSTPTSNASFAQPMVRAPPTPITPGVTRMMDVDMFNEDIAAQAPSPVVATSGATPGATPGATSGATSGATPAASGSRSTAKSSAKGKAVDKAGKGKATDKAGVVNVPKARTLPENFHVPTLLAKPVAQLDVSLACFLLQLSKTQATLAQSQALYTAQMQELAQMWTTQNVDIDPDLNPYLRNTLLPDSLGILGMDLSRVQQFINNVVDSAATLKTG